MQLTFPSPYGVTVIKSLDAIDDYNNGIEFPSPYGVTVIKSCRLHIAVLFGQF